MPKRFTDLWPGPLVLAVLLLATPAGLAGQAVVPNRESVAGLTDLVRTADDVVLAICDGGVSAWTGSPPVIVTRHECRVEYSFKGAVGDVVSVQVLGGQVGNVSMGVSAGTIVTAGKETVLLVRRSRFGPYYVIPGGAQGVLPVLESRRGRTVRGMELDDFVRWLTAASPSAK